MLHLEFGVWGVVLGSSSILGSYQIPLFAMKGCSKCGDPSGRYSCHFSRGLEGRAAMGERASCRRSGGLSAAVFLDG